MSQHTHLLSPLDQHAPRVYTRMALIFPVTDYEPAISNLQDALSKTCSQLPFLKGKVFEKGADDRRQAYITWNSGDPGPQLEEIPEPEGIPSYEILRQDRSPLPAGIFPKVVPRAEAGFEAPVLAASYTKIDGGLVICIAAYHKVLDGGGYGEILRVLAENTRTSHADGVTGGLDADDILMRRERLQGGLPEMPKHVRSLDFDEILKHHPEYSLKSRQSQLHGAAAPGTPKAGAGVNKVIAFSKQKLDLIRAALSDKLPARQLTVNNILTAIIWTSVTYVRTLRAEQPISTTSKMDFSVSGRRFLGPAMIDPPYLGNCLGYALTERPLDELSFIPSLDTIERLVPTIKAIATATGHLSTDFMYEIIELPNKNPDLTDLIPSWFLYGPLDLHFTSWAQIGIYDLDFGPHIGRPQYMRTVVSEFEGIVTFLPRKRVEEGNESIEASVLLKAEDMERLSSDEAWRSWLFKDE
ncbi:transferase family-domain-containing protein [Lophiotrema nucula]|uniref:Transferase family-domain-containing protein n=1 Tax=Lophiotrema nucula TaxID=690887 RepID=A0A6A5ZGP8_9PLEO|nr:transferase family-domain-containing protein [Lophiotrema nucula]